MIAKKELKRKIKRSAKVQMRGDDYA